MLVHREWTEISVKPGGTAGVKALVPAITMWTRAFSLSLS